MGNFNWRTRMVRCAVNTLTFKDKHVERWINFALTQIITSSPDATQAEARIRDLIHALDVILREYHEAEDSAARQKGQTDDLP